MKIIISPAKKMLADTDTCPGRDMPVFMEETEKLMKWIQSLSYADVKKLWDCNDKIAEENYRRFHNMNLRGALTPAILAYDGIQYQYMAPSVFEYGEFDYVQSHLRILSGFYGVLKPMDGVTPYRLEMQAKAEVDGFKNLYEFWGDKIYREVMDESRTVINLASKEYSKCVENYLQPGDRFITCVFGELSEETGKKSGKPRVIQKGVYAKMARGEMVRFMAVNDIREPEQVREFDWSGYSFREDLSTETKYVFVNNSGE